MKKIKLDKIKMYKVGTILSLLGFPVLSQASTSGGVFSSITGPLGTVLTGMQDMGGLVAAGGLIATGLAWWHGGEHKKAMMIGLGATVGGIAMAKAKTLATAITGAATTGHVSTFSLLVEHLPHLFGF